MQHTSANPCNLKGIEMKALSLALTLGLLSGPAIASPAGNGLQLNGLVSNALSLNALGLNALDINSLSIESLAPAAQGSATLTRPQEEGESPGLLPDGNDSCRRTDITGPK